MLDLYDQTLLLLFLLVAGFSSDSLSRPVEGDDDWYARRSPGHKYEVVGPSTVGFHWQDDHTLQSWSPDSFDPSPWSGHTAVENQPPVVGQTPLQDQYFNHVPSSFSGASVAGQSPFDHLYHSEAPSQHVQTPVQQLNSRPGGQEHINGVPIINLDSPSPPQSPSFSPPFQSQPSTQTASEMGKASIGSHYNAVPPSVGTPPSLVAPPSVSAPHLATEPPPAVPQLHDHTNLGLGDPIPNAGLAERDPSWHASFGRSYGKWKNTLRSLLSNPNLEFYTLARRGAGASRVFIAEHGTDARDHQPTTMSPEEFSSNSGVRPHFIYELPNTEKVNMRGLNFGAGYERKFVYLNSREATNYLNEEYFLNRLRFLPIQRKGINSVLLNKMFTSRHSVYMLPPRAQGGLPVLMVRHESEKPLMKKMEALTGKLADQRQIASFWSPVVQEKDRYTIVLYGMLRSLVLIA